MIPKREIMDLAGEQELRPTTVEKDYVLGWLLFAIGEHERLSKWVFKGGTCLKKCFFETYRFSEDLDFTIPESERLEEESVRHDLAEVVEWIESRTGIQFPREGIETTRDEGRPEKRAFQAKVTYRGPLELARRQLQRVKFDLTHDESVVDRPQLRRIHHPYSDVLEPNPDVLCYTLDEILAEKTRATYERQGRARDVYDLVHLSRNFRGEVQAANASRILREKFAYKGLPEPTVDLIVSRVDPEVLRPNWEHQLRHQLPVLPPVDGFLAELRESIAWWFEPVAVAPALAAIRGVAGERPVPRENFPRAVRRLGDGRPARGPRFGALEQVRFAARNRLLAEIEYNDHVRVVEPYSLRLRDTGSTLLYAWEVTKNGSRTHAIRSYKVPEIRSARVLDRPFQPRFIVEL